MVKTKILLQLETCKPCPYVDVRETPGAGYALDYHCTHANNRIVMGYVEWESEEKPVPSWCPHRVK
jgi:hypothetical protein